MNKNNIYKGGKLFMAAMTGAACMTACSEEPDGSNLYDADGLTIEQIIMQRSDLTGFNAILKKCDFDKRIATYKEYTVFAPQNENISLYLDSLYADEGARSPHNGIRDTTSTEVFKSLDLDTKISMMSDSLCKDISQYHISGQILKLSDVTSDMTCSTLLTGRVISLGVAASGPYAGKTSLNSMSYVVDGDIEATNGVLHVCNNVIGRSDRTVSDQINAEGDLKLFYEALTKTGLADTIAIEDKGITYTYAQKNPTNRDGATVYCPTECKVKWTVFAETDAVLNAKGITDFASLKQKCIEWYANPTWYDYVSEKDVQISIADDYDNPWNVVNMFVRYHILRAGLPVDKLVYEYGPTTTGTWNFSFGYEPQDYYETLLPHTLLKVWQTNPMSTKNLYLNRYRQNNTLTDELGTFGSEATHPILFQGVEVDRKAKQVECLNGYVHRIKDVLLYNENAVKAQYERMRFDTSCFLYELANNSIKGATQEEIQARGSASDNSRVAFDNSYFDYIKCYNEGTLLRFCVMGNWRAHNSDQFQGWDVYDFAVKLPSVPTGDYELRIIYPPMDRGGLMQYYIGNSSDQGSMQAIGIPFDARSNPYEDATMGYEDVNTTDESSDYGVAVDQTMHVRGYMRAPASFSRAEKNTVTTKLSYDASDIYSAAKQMTGNTSCRTETGYGTMMLRRVITTQRFEQGKDYWLRIKNLIDDANLGWSFDFIELVPVGIVNSQSMSEDWY